MPCRPESPVARGRLPLVGHAGGFLRGPLAFLDSLRGAGPIVKIMIGPRVAYVVTAREAVREMLVDRSAEFENGTLFDKARPFVRAGVLGSEGAEHRRKRRSMLPALRAEALAAATAAMPAMVAEKVRTWRAGQPVEILTEMHDLAARMLVRSMFGSSLGERAVAEINAHLPVVFRGIGQRCYLPVGFLFALPLPANRRFDAALSRLHTMVDDVIVERRATGGDGRDPIAHLLRHRAPDTGEPLTSDEIHDTVTNLMAGGVETSASVLSWTFHLLGRHPAVAERLEHAAEAGDDGYAGQVVHEVMRLYPPVWLLPKRSLDETEIAGCRIPAGADVFYSPYLLHRDPEVFDGPDRFDPDRWAPGRMRLPRAAYLPFGLGNRYCPGEGYARAQILAILLGTVRQWRLRPSGKQVRPVALTTLYPRGLVMTPQRRVRTSTTAASGTEPRPGS